MPPYSRYDTFLAMLANKNILLEYKGSKFKLLDYRSPSNPIDREVIGKYYEPEDGTWHLIACNYDDITEATKPNEGELYWFWTTESDLIAGYFDNMCWEDYSVRLEKNCRNGRITFSRKNYAPIDKRPVFPCSGVIDIHGFKFTWEFIGEFNKNFDIDFEFVLKAIQQGIDSFTFTHAGNNYTIEFNYLNKTLAIKHSVS